MKDRLVEDPSWESALEGLSFDGEGDRAIHPPLLAPTAPTTTATPSPLVVQRSGRSSTRRIGASSAADRESLAMPQGPDNPMRDTKVLAELHQVAKDEHNVDFPYIAQVTTRLDPLRVRISATLSAAIITHLPRGTTVTVTGKSQNHFRPISFVDAASPGKTLTGFAFTTYLSPPKLKHAPSAAHEPQHEAATAAEEVATPQPTPAQVVEAATVANTDEAIAARVIGDLKNLNGATPSLTTGVHYKDQYKQALVAAGRGHEWDRRWEMGHTASSLWLQPYDQADPFTFVLQEGKSASEGLRQWLAGLTVTDCTTAMVAIELDAVRAVVGDRLFDRCFGSADGTPPRIKPLKISQRLADTPLYELMRFTDGARGADKQRGELGKRPVKAGEWYYFFNHPDYVLKHPGGVWRGENALCLGDKDGAQMWSGFGATSTEEGMLRALLEKYNAPRDEADFSWLELNYTIRENWPAKYTDGFAATAPGQQPVPNKGPRDQVNIDQIVAEQKKPSKPEAPADTFSPIVEARQKEPAGLDVSSGMVLSTTKLAALIKTYGEDSHPASTPSGSAVAKVPESSPQVASSAAVIASDSDRSHLPPERPPAASAPAVHHPTAARKAHHQAAAILQAAPLPPRARDATRVPITPELLAAMTPTPTPAAEPADSHRFARISGPLYARGFHDTSDIDPNDVIQGKLGDCYFLSALAAIARANPDYIRRLIKQVGPHTYEVTLYARDHFWSARTPHKIVIDDQFPIDSHGEPAYAQRDDFAFGGGVGSVGWELWVMLLEKAYATLEGGYAKIGDGRFGADAMGALLPGGGTDYAVSNYTPDALGKLFATAIQDHRPLETCTGARNGAMVLDNLKQAHAWLPEWFIDKTLEEARNVGAATSHMYSIVSVDLKTRRMKIQNPWGFADLDLTFEQYQQAFFSFTLGAP